MNEEPAGPHELADDQVPVVLADPGRCRSWPPAFFAGAPGDASGIAEAADRLLRQGFGR